MSVIGYDTGTTTSLANLLASILDKADEHGWTVAGANVSKAGLSMSLTTTGSGNLEVLMAQGTAGGVLSPGPSYLLAGRFGGQADASLRDILWPATYHIVVYDDPDMIVVSLNHDSIYWQHLIFGFANNLGSTGLAGELPFHWSSFHAPYGGDVCNLWPSPYDGTGLSRHAAIPFNNATPTYAPLGESGFAYLNEGAGFENSATNPAFKWAPHPIADGAPDLAGAINCSGDFPGGTFSVAKRQPNLANGDCVFATIKVALARPDSFWSWMFEIPHIRLARNDYYADGEIVTKGSDQWMIVPCRRKNLLDRKADSFNNDDSGSYAFAILTADT